jgi:hypothetical protein
MVRIFCKTILTLCCTILLVAAAQAKSLKEVYLRDGGIIECKKVWQANGKVMVLVNRDTLLDLSRSEVDMKKTFAKKHAKAVKKTRHREKAITEQVSAKTQPGPEPQAKPVVAPATQHKPEAPPKPAAKKVAAVTKPAAPVAKPAPVTPAAKPAPAAPKQPVAPAKAKTPTAAKQAVQQAATSAKKEGSGAAVTPPGAPRANLPLAKPATPPEAEKSLLSGNMTTIGLVALLVLLVIGLVVYKKKSQG